MAESFEQKVKFRMDTSARDLAALLNAQTSMHAWQSGKVSFLSSLPSIKTRKNSMFRITGL